MSRYRVQLLPQGAIPRPIEIGVRLTPLGVPPAAAEVAGSPSCEVSCGSGIGVNGWAMADGIAMTVSASAPEEPVPMPSGPWSVRATMYDATPCDGEFSWGLTDDIGEDYAVIFLGREVWFFGGSCEGYSGTLTLQPKRDGEDWCDPLVLVFDGGGGGDQPGDFFDISDAACFHEHSSTITFTDARGPDWTTVGSHEIIQASGDFVSGSPTITYNGDGTFTLDFSTIIDWSAVTGSSETVTYAIQFFTSGGTYGDPLLVTYCG